MDGDHGTGYAFHDHHGVSQLRDAADTSNSDEFGAGGIGGIYEVAAGSYSACVIQTRSSTGSWPTQVQTSAIPAVASLTSTLTAEITETTEKSPTGQSSAVPFASSSTTP